MQEDRQETEVRETNTRVGDTSVERRTVDRRVETPGVVVAQRIVWFIVGAISVVIALRFVLLLLGANQGAAFTDFVYSLSGVFVAPFVGIFGEPSYGSSVFEISSLLAIAVYLLIGWGIAKLLTLSRPHQEI
ncbi:hypothetical protein B7Y94_03420 [Candidatus Saccharibacteria bacterium 32-49-12]|nr:MAG: hypothetical protein B7Y94_03420 [Candidatus Saccharibacteria bacterium 32-49-12]